MILMRSSVYLASRYAAACEKVGSARVQQASQATEKVPHTFCHSERSEESLFLFMRLNQREIPRFARNDKIDYVFRSLFSLRGFGLARPKPHRLKPVLLGRCALIAFSLHGHLVGNRLGQGLLGYLAEWRQRKVLHDLQSLGKLVLGDFLAEQKIFQLVETQA